MPETQTSQTSQTSYVPRLNLFDAAMAVVGGIIGGGIWRNPAAVAAQVGTPTLSIAVWVLGGVIALAGAFVFAELGARRPQAGGGYVYLRDAFGPMPAFLYGWALLLVINTGALAWVAMNFATYASELFGFGAGARLPMAMAAIAVLSVINFYGVKLGATTQNVLTVLKLGALAVVIAVGMAASGDAAAAAAAPPKAPVGAWQIFTVVGAALVPVLFTYGGWQNTSFIAGEIRDAQKKLPRALLIGVGIVILVYVLASTSYLHALGIGGLAASKAPASDTMRAAFGEIGGRFIAAGIMISTFGFLNLVILASPRVYQAMAADGVFFQSVARLHPRYRTPWLAIVIQAIVTLAVLGVGKENELINYNAIGDWIFFGLSGATIFVFRAREARSALAFRMPFHPWPSIVFCLAAVYAIFSAVTSATPIHAATAVGLIVAGIPFYLVWARIIAAP